MGQVDAKLCVEGLGMRIYDKNARHYVVSLVPTEDKGESIIPRNSFPFCFLFCVSPPKQQFALFDLHFFTLFLPGPGPGSGTELGLGPGSRTGPGPGPGPNPESGNPESGKSLRIAPITVRHRLQTPLHQIQDRHVSVFIQLHADTSDEMALAWR